MFELCMKMWVVTKNRYKRHRHFIVSGVMLQWERVLVKLRVNSIQYLYTLRNKVMIQTILLSVI